MPRYKTLRLREEDYEKLKDVQRYLRRKGTERINWTELRDQDIVDLADEDDDDENGSSDLTAGFVIGLGAAALAYLVYKGLQKNQGSR
jgi:hypothetical protein